MKDHRYHGSSMYLDNLINSYRDIVKRINQGMAKWKERTKMRDGPALLEGKDSEAVTQGELRGREGRKEGESAGEVID